MNIRQELKKHIHPVTDFLVSQVESKLGDGEKIKTLQAGVFYDGFFSPPVVWINGRRHVLELDHTGYY